jgi:D-sedoheptulose 7-phosphate isomerase
VSRDTEYVGEYLAETIAIAEQLDHSQVAALADELVGVRSRGGRLFAVGSGGGAGHASHAVADLRKLAGIEAYTPTDNISELTARINDDGWETSYVEWLNGSRLSADDLLVVFSVGGGDRDRGVSVNLLRCLELALSVGTRIVGIVGRHGGATARAANACVVVPTVNETRVTPHTEGWQAVIWHLLVSHPAVRARPMKWESLTT